MRPVLGTHTGLVPSGSHPGTWDVPIPYIHSLTFSINVSIVRICSNVIYACMLQSSCDHRRSSRDPHPSCELCRKASQLSLCNPQDTCECCTDLRLDSWNILLRARRKRIWGKQRREEATGTITDANVTTANGPVRDSPSAIPQTDSVPPSQGEEDMITQDIGVASQTEAPFSDVLDASDKPTHVEVESTGMYSSEEEEEVSESDFDEMTQISPE